MFGANFTQMSREDGESSSGSRALSSDDYASDSSSTGNGAPPEGSTDASSESS